MNDIEAYVGSARPAHIWRGAAVGLVGGVVAAGAMSLGHSVLARLPGLDGAGPPQAEQGDDATVKVADVLMRRLLARPLPEDAKPVAGNIVHYAFGGVVGALYGAAAELVPRITTGFGLAWGVSVWLGAHVITVPALGLAESPARRPLSKEASEPLLHLLYGVTTELIRRPLRGRSL
jgi:putative membrane protein